MKKLLLQSIFILLITNPIFAQRQVKKTISNDFWVDSLKIYKNYSTQNIVETYNKANKLSKIQTNVIYTNNQQETNSNQLATSFSQTYTYDNKNRLVELYSKNGSGEFQSRNFLEKRFRRYEYNEIDSLSQLSFGLFDDSLGVEFIYNVEKCEYNINKKLVSKKNFFLNWPYTQSSKLYLFSDRIYEYNIDGQIILDKYIQITPNNSSTETNYFYDGNKKLISLESDQPNNAYKQKIEYDENGNIKKECGFNKNNSNEFVINSCINNLYDSRKNLLKREYLFYLNGKLDFGGVYEYQFNETNKVIYEKFNYINKDKVEYPGDEYEVIYKYSDKGNLLQKIRKNDTRYLNNITTNFKYNDQNELLEEIEEKNVESSDFYGKQYIYKELTTTKIEYSNSLNEDAIPEILVFPNPANTQVTVLSSTENDCLSMVTLNDFTGKEILKFETNRKNYYQCSWRIDLPSYILPGEYIVAMKTGNGKNVGKRLKIIK